MANASFLESLIDDVRLAIDNPVAGARFDDAAIIRWAGSAMRRVSQDIARVSARPVVLAFDFTIPAGTTVYQLPPSVGTIIEIGGWDDDVGAWSWTLLHTSRRGPFRPNMHLSGRRVVLDKALDEAVEMRIEYKPSGDFLPHEGVRTLDSLTLAGDEIALVEPADEATGLLRGLVDDRQNAYVGAMLRVWSPESVPAVVQERLVLSHVIDSTADATRLLTVDADFDPVLEADDEVTWQYELLPAHFATEGVRACVVLASAMTLCAMSGMDERKTSLVSEYQAAIRTEELAEAYGDLRNQKWRKDTFQGRRRL